MEVTKTPPTISLLAERQGPVILRTESLFSSLQACMMFANTEIAAQTRVSSSNGVSQSLAVALTSISNSGMDTLVDVHKFLNDVRGTAEAMADDGGTLEMLQETHGKLKDQPTHQRLLARLHRQVEKCKVQGEGLTETLAIWQREVRNMQNSLHEQQGRTAEEVAEHRKTIASNESEVSRAQKAVNEQKACENKAQMKYEKSTVNQTRLADAGFATVAVLKGDWTKVLSIAVSYGWSAIVSKGAAKEVRTSQEELERRRRAADKFNAELEEVQHSICILRTKEGSLIHGQMAFAGTLNALAQLTENVSVLVLEFSTILSDTEMLVTTNEDVQEAAADQELAFFNDSTRARDLARKVQYLAWLYSSIIQNVMINGLRDISVNPDTYSPATSYPRPPSVAASLGQLTITAPPSQCAKISQNIDDVWVAKTSTYDQRVEKRRTALAKTANRKPSIFSRRKK